VIVSDTSPVRAPADLGRPDLLRDLFTEVVVPPAVARELEKDETLDAAIARLRKLKLRGIA
jgi:predicted nucleic acid-binding protein